MSSSSDKEAFSKIVVGILIFLAAPFMALWKAYVMSCLWVWLVVPGFSHAPAVSTGQFFVVSVVFSCFVAKPSSCKKEEKDAEGHLVDAISYGILFPAISLGFGWLVRMAFVNHVLSY